MSEIEEWARDHAADVLKKAIKDPRVAGKMALLMSWTPNVTAAFGDAIARALMDERARCAKIALSFAAPDDIQQIDYDQACRDIADAILKGES